VPSLLLGYDMIYIFTAVGFPSGGSSR